ncbi:DnaJ-like N-terminal domain-containing protein [Encephalitozoon intestinalis ATCC 50506]|uniref:DnaJ-like N-terminal domain-containing protein n=1 Tax=Encephalitozoon intestinalis (strain ATCC 50506) TaxID=876142 RepID=E0S5N8_ENCIT|nr:DnaJ-like N-terminal domain-containing protein [Encephalitozoon intestinalis ATCC 50506]ADM11023.1 DnaJ-like N-terminal domain-containing protein [Encephalitozoon intestinalis ATCC 50506]UTX44671.1 DnaJ domain-containing protein [Encephalitozoon intestinalis]
MSLYDVLKVPKNATKESVEKSYRFLVRTYFQNKSEISPDKFAEINKAYTILKDRYKRDFYDIFGEVSVQLLLHNKDSYIVTRMFDRLNICFYLVTFAIYLGTLLALPPMIAHGEYNSIAMSLPFGVSAITLTIPMIRSLSALYWIYGMGAELKSMIFRSMEIIGATLHLFNYASYVDGLINTSFSGALFLGIEGLSTVNTIYYHSNKYKLFFETKKNIMMGKLIRAILFGLVMVPAIPVFLKPFLLLMQILWGICGKKYSLKINACMLLLPLLYIATLSLVLAGFRSILIYLPLWIFGSIIMIVLALIASNIVNNIPKSKYDVREAEALPYYDIL